jgi:Uma2 family endonuclease
MAVETLIPVEEYLHTSYSPDREYLDGVLLERNEGDRSHARLQGLLATYLVNREDDWKIEVFTEPRIRLRKDWYPIPDIAVYQVPAPAEPVPSKMPLLWIEILSPDDSMMRVLEKARLVVGCGCPYVWIIDPDTLESHLRTSAGLTSVPDNTLRVPDTSIVIPLLDVMKKK